VFVSFNSLLSLHEKDYGFVKAGQFDDALLRDDLHFERWDPTGSFQSQSDVSHRSTNSTVRPLQRASGNNKSTGVGKKENYT
jgi:hypothetical protein